MRTSRFILNADGECIAARCSKCKRFLDVSHFNKHHGQNKYGIRSECKQCQKKSRKIYFENNRDEINRRKSKRYYASKHSPCLYLIEFWDDSVYIGQTRNVPKRKEGHIERSKQGKVASKHLSNLCKENPEKFRECVNNLKVIKYFDRNTDSLDVDIEEYNLQIDYMLSGRQVIGAQYNDKSFKLFAYGRLGFDKAIEILNMNKKFNSK